MSARVRDTMELVHRWQAEGRQFTQGDLARELGIGRHTLHERIRMLRKRGQIDLPKDFIRATRTKATEKPNRSAPTQDDIAAECRVIRAEHVEREREQPRRWSLPENPTAADLLRDWRRRTARRAMQYGGITNSTTTTVETVPEVALSAHQAKPPDVSEGTTPQPERQSHMGSDRPKMQQHAEAMLAAAEELERQGQRVTAYAACKRAGIPRSNSTIYRQALGDRWRWAVLDRGWRVTKARSNGKRNGHRPAPASPGDDQAELRRSLATTGAIGPIEVMPAAEQAVAAIARWNGTPLNGREMGEDHVAGEIDVARVLVVALKIDRILADLSLSEALALLRALNVVRQANSAGI